MTNTALNRTTILQLRNKSGSTQSQGAVVVIDTGTEKSFETTTTESYVDTQIGVVIEPAGILNDEIGSIALAGWVPKINLTSSASIGNYVTTSTVAGQGKVSTAAVKGSFAEVTEAGTTPEAFLMGYATRAGAEYIADTSYRWYDGVTGDRLIFEESIPILTSGILKSKTWGYIFNDDALAKNVFFKVFVDAESGPTATVQIPAGNDYNYTLETALIDTEGAITLHYELMMNIPGSTDITQGYIVMDDTSPYSELPGEAHTFKIMVNIADADVYVETMGTLLEGPFYR